MLSRLFRRETAPAPATPRWDLSTELLRWTRSDAWTIGDAVEGTFVTGATGAGKSSGSGALLADAFLRAGFGGLVLTAKADERATWERYAREAGRQHDLMVVGADAALTFNFMDFECRRAGAGAGLTENLVRLFGTVSEIAERHAGGGGGREGEQFWKRTGDQLLRAAIDLASLATGGVTIPDLYKIVISAPTSAAQKASPEWQAKSLCFAYLKEADRRPKTKRQQGDLELVADYFLVEFPELSEKTRSIIVSGFTSMADLLLRGTLRELFCAETTVTPDAIPEGKIVLLDLPVKEFGEVGQIAQVIFKHAFQRHIERRDTKNSRPVFLWADEAQHFFTSYDMEFQTTCRSSRVATVYLTQNVSNVYAALGGTEKARHEASSLFANLSTKVLHANGDPVTNEWAASLIGRSRQFFANGSTSRSAESMGPMSALGWPTDPTNTSSGLSESYEHEVQPASFTTLRTGGAKHGGKVDAIVFQNGRRFRNGKTWLPVTFEQARRTGA